jgi:lipopolysaccharide transport system ATP-binding protein
VPEGRIEFQHVWKKFRRGELHDSLRDLVPAVAARFLGRRPTEALATREFWAVQDVTFSVRPGDALGIIGPNGAGKSTILKLLTRILKPTQGRCGIRGRVGALIEIAAGFHQDLTGGENVFLQGSIMGMTRREIESRFDDIVAFSELSEFIDTPVKRYSSGMNARLGFAIAAHMSPDVLIVDEVLAVGDYRFQRKAFDRIGEMVRRGLPVVIVSHQLERIASLCNDCLLLDRGRIVKRGHPEECISHYLMAGVQHEPDPEADMPFRITALDIEPKTPIRSGDWMSITVRGEVTKPVDPDYRLEIRVRALQNAQIVNVVDLTSREPRLAQPGVFEATVQLQANMFNGYFSIETPVWHIRERREVGQSMKGLVRVEGAAFFGTTNLHPRVQIALNERTPVASLP